MKTTIPALIGAIGFAMLLAEPGYAQQTAKPVTRVATNQQVNNNNPKGPTGTLEQSHGEWRASKLVGANVYNQSGNTIGSIDDLLVNDSGKIDNVIVSVGGFLGIGNKLVEVPFNQFKFEESTGNHVAAAGNRTTTVPGLAAAGPGVQPAAPWHGPANTAPRAAAANSQPVQYSVVLPNATKDSLTSAAGFNYSS